MAGVSAFQDWANQNNRPEKKRIAANLAHIVCRQLNSRRRLGTIPHYQHCESCFKVLRLASAARVAKLADALDLGSCALNGVGVQLPPLAFFILFAMGESVLTLDNAEGK